MKDTTSFTVSFKGTHIGISDWPISASLGDLKAHLEELTGIPAQGQKIMFKGVLKKEDNKTIADLNITDGQKLIMMGSPAVAVEKVLQDDKRVARGSPFRGRQVRPSKTATGISPYTF